MPLTATLHVPDSPPRSLRADEVPAALDDGRGLLWVDVASPTAEDAETLTGLFTMHPLQAEDMLHPHQRPKADITGGSMLVIAYGTSLEQGRVVLHEVAVLAGQSSVVTVRHAPAQELVDARERLAAASTTAPPGPGYLLYLVLDELVDTYVPVLAGFDGAMERIEKVLLSERYERARLSAAFALRRDLLDMQGVVLPMPEVLDTVCSLDRVAIARDLDAELRDVRDHAVKAIERLDRFDQLLQTSTAIYLSGVSAELNNVVLKVSGWAAILVAPTLIASIYGMNFRHMPELEWQLGYPYALGLMVLVAGVLYWSFKRRGWL